MKFTDDKSFKDQSSHEQTCLKQFGRRYFLTVRTERALRFIIPLPLALWLSYDNVLNTNFGYFVVVLYTVFSALMPPSPATVSLLCWLGLPCILTGLGYTTGLLNLALLDLEISTTNALVLVCYAAYCLFCSTLRIGTLASMMTIGLFAMIYSVDQALAQTYVMVRDGAEIGINPKVVYGIILQIDTIIKILLSSSKPMYQMLAKILMAIKEFGTFPPCPVIDIRNPPAFIQDVECEINFPVNLLKDDPNAKYFKDAKLLIQGRPDEGLFLHIQPDKWFNDLLWFAKGRFGIVYGGIVNGMVAIALVALAVYLPPPRFMKSLLRSGCQDGVNSLKNKHTAMLLDTGLITKKDLNENGRLVCDDIENPTSTVNSFREKKPCPCRKRKKQDIDPPISRLASKITVLKGPLLLSLFEQLFSSPLGVNTFVAAPEVLRSITNGAIQTSVLEKLSLKGSSRMARIWSAQIQSLSGEIHVAIDVINPHVKEWIVATAVDSLKLQMATHLAISIEARINKDEGQKHLIEDAYSRLEFERKALAARQEQFADMLVMETSTRLKSRPSSFTAISESQTWLNQFVLTFVDSPMQLSAAVRQWLQAQRRRRFRAFMLSVAGCVAPLGLLLLSWFGPWARAFKVLFTACKKPVPLPPSIIEQSYGHHKLRDNTTDTSLYPWASKETSFQFSDKIRNLTSYNGKLGIWYHWKFWMCIRFCVGCTSLMALILYVDSWANLNATGVQRLPNQIKISETLALPIIAKFDFLEKSQTAGWTMLGFLTAFVITWQGTLKRSMLRLCGVLVGTFLGWCCMMIFHESPPEETSLLGVTSGGWGTGQAYGQLLWLMVTNFIIVWLSANPVSPASGFDPSWGYAAQVMTYQQTIIICETHLGQNYLDEIVLERLAGQGVGILTAALVSCLIVPCDVNSSFAIFLSNSFHYLSYIILPLAELSSICLLRADPDNIIEQWLTVYKEQMDLLSKQLENLTILKTDNGIFQEFPKLRTKPIWLILHDSVVKMQITRQETFNILTSLLRAEERLVDQELPHLDAHPLSSSPQSLKRKISPTTVLMSSRYEEDLKDLDEAAGPDFSSYPVHQAAPSFHEPVTKFRPYTDHDDLLVQTEKLAKRVYHGAVGGFKSNGDDHPQLWARLESDESAYEIVAQGSPIILRPQRSESPPRKYDLPRYNEMRPRDSLMRPYESYQPREVKPYGSGQNEGSEARTRQESGVPQEATSPLASHHVRTPLHVTRQEEVSIMSKYAFEFGTQTSLVKDDLSSNEPTGMFSSSSSSSEFQEIETVSLDELRRALMARGDGELLMSVLRCIERLHIILENVIRSSSITTSDFEEATFGGIQYCNIVLMQLNAKTAVLRMHFHSIQNQSVWAVALKRRSAFLHFLLVEIQEISKLMQVILTLHFKN